MFIDSTPPIAEAPKAEIMQSYRALLQRPESDLRAELSEKFKDKEFIFVRGFLTDVLDHVGAMMEDQRRAVEGLGRPVSRMQAPFDSENAPDVNATVIARMVKSASRPVILFTHSKGSVDALAALVNYPAIRQKIKGWVSLQGALQGSPVADFVAGTSGGRWALEEIGYRALLGAVFTTLFNGGLASLDSLRTRERADYLGANRQEIAGIVGEISSVAFGSAASPDRSALRRATAPFFATEPNNDGLVSVERSVLPGAKIVHDLHGPDHAEAVIDIPGPQNWDRVRLTYALLGLL